MESIYTKLAKKAEDLFFVTEKEFICIVILTSFLTFLSFIGHIRTELSPTFEIDGHYMSYYGFPLEWFKMTSHLHYSWYTVTKFEIIWVGLALDLTLYILFSLVLVRVINEVAE